MPGKTLTGEEKQRLLRTLEEDREFRYALMGLLGYKEILERITGVEKRFAELAERQQKLEERMVGLEERMVKLEERFADLEERFLKLEERVARLEERFADLEERFLKLEERVARLEEGFLELAKRQQRLEEEMISLRRSVEHTRRDVGALTEATYSRMVLEDLREEAMARGERIVRRLRNARINGHEIDLLVETDKRVFVVEVKIQPNHHDVDELVEKTKAAAKTTGKQATAVLAGTWVGGEVREYCRVKRVQLLEY